ncbi:hypothetical protein CFK37_08840 [Virgibacillus phasianinus]|uniref:Amidohydrolase 3 domain-containing protein n=1 Tax=Virgibacillus phasianinus TaxID=2017483 RepID=A0A220U2E5_9BACI|nr:amidohydrolase [Virgibacillus phasianinus]ASK62260.1 hypothetical protein CFK37_08840 [Virgibacillus phasianinus]
MITADLLIKNGIVLTLDAQNTRAGSVAVKDGQIAGVWSQANPPEGEVQVTVQTKVVDLKGETLIPGFIDTHNHILGYAQIMDFVYCGTPPNKQIDDVLQAIHAKAEKTPAGEWVKGYGYDDTLLAEKRHLTRKELDKAAPDHPVFVTHVSGHLAVANSAALELAGIDEGVSDVQQGQFGRDDDGRLNGVLYEKMAMAPVAQVLPKQSEEDMVEQLGRAAQEYLAQGITMNTDAAVGMLGKPDREMRVHMEAAKQGVNPMRTQLMMMHNFLQENERFGDYTKDKLDQELREQSDGRVRLDGAKMFQDGSIQALTAALREPYHNDAAVTGNLFHDQQDFNEEIIDLHKRGFRIAIHGNGDRAIGSIIEGYAHALEAEPRAEHRHRIEHVQTATPEDIKRMAELDVAGSFFINHVYYWGERHRELFLGTERAERISPLADAVKDNILFTLHSDCPVTPISPLFSVWAAVNRVTSEGNVLGADQRIDVTTALKSMTIYGAALNFDEENSGSIEVGKRADFAVLDEDPTMINPSRIKDISVQATIIDGETVYQKG